MICFIRPIHDFRPYLAIARHGLGVAVYKHDPQYAVENLLEAIRLSPDHTPSYGFLGYAYERLGQREVALAAYNRAVEAAAGNPYAEVLWRARARTLADGSWTITPLEDDPSEAVRGTP